MRASFGFRSSTQTDGSRFAFQRLLHDDEPAAVQSTLCPAKLQLQVHLRSSGPPGYLRSCRHLSPSGSGVSERRHAVRAPVLRGARAYRLGTRGVWPPAIPQGGSPADRVHRVRAAHRPDAGGDRRGAGPAPFGKRAEPTGLGAIIGRLDLADRSADCGAGSASGGPHPMHRLWLSFHRSLPAGESRRSHLAARARPAVLAGGCRFGAGWFDVGVESRVRTVRTKLGT